MAKKGQEYNLQPRDNGYQHLRNTISRIFESSLVGFGSLDDNPIKGLIGVAKC
jgi:hypothetical protein